MKRILARRGGVVVVDVAEPPLEAGDVLVETAFSVVSSGTETHIIHATRESDDVDDDQYPRSRSFGPQVRDPGVRWSGPSPRRHPPGYGSLGYSLAGTVIRVGAAVTDLRPGDRVACSGNQCAVHAERVAVPRHLVARVPESIRLDQAAFVTLGAISMQGLRRTGCQLGETIVVTGLGLLGLLTAQIARAAGLNVIGIDPDAERRALAGRLGVQLTLDPSADDCVKLVRRETGGFGADGVLLCVATESSEPLNLAFELSRQRGAVVGVGAFGMCIDRSRMFGADVAFYPTLAYGPGRYDPVYEEGGVDYPIGYVRWTENRNMQAFLRLLADGRVDVEPLAPRPFSVDAAAEAFGLLLTDGARPPTVIFSYAKE